MDGLDGWLLSKHITRQTNAAHKRWFTWCMQRFEAQDATSVLELESSLSVLKATHEQLSKHVILRPFDLFMADVNEGEPEHVFCWFNIVSFRYLHSPL